MDKVYLFFSEKCVIVVLDINNRLNRYKKVSLKQRIRAERVKPDNPKRHISQGMLSLSHVFSFSHLYLPPLVTGQASENFQTLLVRNSLCLLPSLAGRCKHVTSMFSDIYLGTWCYSMVPWEKALRFHVNSEKTRQNCTNKKEKTSNNRTFFGGHSDKLSRQMRVQ